MTAKQISFWIGLILSIVAGCYLASFIFLLMVKLSTSYTGLTTYFRYYSAYASNPLYANKLNMAGLLGFGLPLGVFSFIAYKIATLNKDNSLYGNARFADLGDLKKAGFLQESPTSIVVGKKDGQYLHFSGQQFVILAAPTRSGKGVGIVIPNLLTYKGSMVVLDIKQENFELTSGFRGAHGQAIYLFNPFAEDKRTHRWNPLTYVSNDPNFRVSDLMSIAQMLYPLSDNDQNKFFVSQAQNVFLALSLYMFERYAHISKGGTRTPPQKYLPTIGNLYRLSSGGGAELKPYLQDLSQTPYLSQSARTAFAGILSQAEETFASIMGSFKEPLLPWLNPVVDAATSGDDFLLTDVRKRKMTIYVGIQPNKLAESRLIVNLFFSQLINQNTKELPQNNPDLKYQCLLLMDEFTSIGKVDIIAKAVSYMAGYNIRLLPIIQSMAQLDATYGKEQARTLITNHALQIIYAPREQQDANDYSEMLGYTSVKKESISRSKDISKTENEEKRALMLPQELKAMGADKEVFLFEGLAHPVMCDKIKYYQDPAFKTRLMPKVDVKEIVLLN